MTNISSKIAKIMLAMTVALAFYKPAYGADSHKEKSYYTLQAELIYNFVDYVKWPGEVKKKNLCVMEDSPIIPHLTYLLKAKAKDLTLVRKYENDYLQDCHILFINDYYDGYLKRLLYKVGDKPILTFGNDANFADSGGIVQFSLRHNRVRFTIDKKAMLSSHLDIHHSILSISNIINPE